MRDPVYVHMYMKPTHAQLIQILPGEVLQIPLVIIDCMSVKLLRMEE